MLDNRSRILEGTPFLHLLTASEVEVLVLRSELAPSAPQPTGSVTFIKGGVTIGTASLNSSGRALVTYTPPFSERNTEICFDVQYFGDSVWRADSVRICKLVRGARPTLTLTSPSSTYTFGLPTQFTARLTFPRELGMVGTQVEIDGNGPNSDFRDSIILTPGVGEATGSRNITLPLALANGLQLGLFGTYHASGDLFVGATSMTLTMNKIATTVALSGPTSPASNPMILTATVSYPTAIPLSLRPRGRVEFRDGSVVLGMVDLPTSGAAPVSQTVAVVLNGVIRPVGVHNFQAFYSGDDYFANSQSVVINTTVQ